MLVAHLDGQSICQSAMFPAITSLRQFLSSRLIFLLKNNFYVREVDCKSRGGSDWNTGSERDKNLCTGVYICVCVCLSERQTERQRKRCTYRQT